MLLVLLCIKLIECIILSIFLRHTFRRLVQIICKISNYLLHFPDRPSSLSVSIFGFVVVKYKKDWTAGRDIGYNRGIHNTTLT